ncbi:hypothetical protein [Sphingobacterium sp. SYP-B4668]|uniref:hypothetical protein n=1 Tax=Sphingobacterium sp. SYP-B4668 TaxID=2996035 RepID=UPI0022DD1C8D|nr:hypothetical protein [Sphingobacterium sp. SYP-B4668]
MARSASIYIMPMAGINHGPATVVSGRTLFKAMLLYVFVGYISLSSATGQEAQPFDTIVTELIYRDAYGINELYVKVTNPCNEELSRFDGPLTRIEAQVKSKEGSTAVAYEHPYAQMSLIHFVKEEIQIQDVGGRKAVVIPFYYCGGYESYDRKVSYILFYENKNYIFHLDYYCGEGEDCKPVQSLKVTLQGLPKDIRTYFARYLAKKHKSKVSFHQE